MPRNDVRRNARYTPLDVDGPLPRHMVRAVPAIRSDVLGFLRGCVDTYGDLVALPIPNHPVLLVNDPAAVGRVLLSGHARYGKATVQYSALARVTGVGLLTAEREDWRPRRAVVHAGFHHGRMPDVAGVAGDAAAALRAELDGAAGRLQDVEAPVLRTMLDVVSRTLFDLDLADVPGPGTGPGAEHALGGRLVEAVDEALHEVIARAQLPLPRWLSGLTAHRERRLDAAVARIDDACARIVAARRARADVDGTRDVLGLLLQAQDAGALDARQVRDELVTMVIAGHETVASALTWTLHLLSRHPAEQARLAEELDAVLGPGEGGRMPTWDDLGKLPRTRAVLDEALRLYPPAWVITRTALVDDEVAGVAVPAGTLVIISPWLVHRRRQVWPDPDRFCPDRFLPEGLRADGSRDGAAPSSSRPTTDYLPFGLGPRLCIGRDLALLEGVLVLAGLLRGRRVLPGPAAQVPVDAMITMRPRGGLPLRFVPRERGPR